MEHDFVFAFGPIEHGQRDADGHVLPVRMLDGMERDTRFQNGDRTIGHSERRIVLAVPIERIMLTKPNVEHIRDFEDALVAVELLQVDRQLDREAVCCIRRRSELGLRRLHGEHTPSRL